MNQANKLRGESQHYKLLFELKKTKVQDCKAVILQGLNGFSEGKNCNPMKHCKWHDKFKHAEILI